MTHWRADWWLCSRCREARSNGCFRNILEHPLRIAGCPLEFLEALRKVRLLTRFDSTGTRDAANAAADVAHQRPATVLRTQWCHGIRIECAQMMLVRMPVVPNQVFQCPGVCAVCTIVAADRITVRRSATQKLGLLLGTFHLRGKD